MRFRVLGPLELSDDDRPVPLQGSKQRAVLGHVLLNANRVVSVSALMDVLWPQGETPNSARKILHNAIWGLRGVLTAGGEHAAGAALLTRPPGYVLQVDPEAVDLFEFRRLAEQGQGQLAAGSPESAAVTLRRALGLWRGNVLADLVEEGFNWPELAGIDHARTDVLEDCFDAELALGRHQSVLREIEAAVEGDALRERLCGQLMLALYRCGRHTEALGLYIRVRERLVGELGLEPGQHLQELQQAILRHDACLLVRDPAPREQLTVRPPEPLPSVPRPRTASRSGAPVGPAHAVLLAGALPTRPSGGPPEGDLFADEAPSADPHTGTAGAGEGAGGVTRPCSVVMVHPTVEGEPAGVYAAGQDDAVEDVLGRVSRALREVADWLGGTVVAPAGPAQLVVFTGIRAAERAVSAALALQTCESGGQTLRVRAAVATGEAHLYRFGKGPDAPAMVGGPVADTCRALLARAAAGTVRVCATTRERTGEIVAYGESGSPTAGWRVRSAHWHALSHPSLPIIDRESELDVLTRLFDRSRHREVSQLVTVLGRAGVGKTRLLLEFERRAMARWDDLCFLVSGPEAGARPLGLLRDLLLALAEAPRDTDPEEAAGLLRRITHGCALDPDEAAETERHITELITSGPDGPPAHRTALLHTAGRSLLRAVATRRPLVIFVDDGHELDEESLDFLENLVDPTGPPSLMVVLAARPQLLDRRPTWGSGRTQGATLTLAPLSDTVLDRLTDIVHGRLRQGVLRLPTRRLADRLGTAQARPARRDLLRTLMRLDVSRPPQRSPSGAWVLSGSAAGHAPN
ncbi:BTAD domain-containing putative transcriptional regulator [Streptomyces sp. NPDC004539]|uniref:BTAD domain-containing putative transcriptional regulator n=1 Tax=Streptomyces sp. NPDC004539 TaxID=3154280 RepID=UPI0033A4DDB2